MNNGNLNIISSFLILFASAQLSYSNPLNLEPDSWQAKLMYVNTSAVIIYTDQATDSEIVGDFKFMEKILVIEDPNVHVRFGWKRVFWNRGKF